MDFERRERSCKARLPFRCKHCARRFSRMSELHIHSKMHKKPVPNRKNRDDRQPIPKMVIRRNSSPIKKDGRAAGVLEEYEIVDLTTDEPGSDQSAKEQMSILKSDPSVLCSPSQKDSGIDDSSPQSYDEVSDTAEQSKPPITEPVYSPCLDVKDSGKVENHNDSVSNSCGTCMDKSQTDQRQLPDSTTPSSTAQCYTVQLPPADQIKVANTGNGFITIDLDHLKNIVGVGSMTDSDGNIALTLPQLSGAARNIFDVINCANKSDNQNDDYVPSPKKPRRSNDFDTGDSQFNFYDSNQVDNQPAPEPMFSDTESEQDSHNISGVIETHFESGVEDEPIGSPDGRVDNYVHSVSGEKVDHENHSKPEQTNSGDDRSPEQTPLESTDQAIKFDQKSDRMQHSADESNRKLYDYYMNGVNLCSIEKAATPIKQQSVVNRQFKSRNPDIPTMNLDKASKRLNLNDSVILIDSDTDVNDNTENALDHRTGDLDDSSKPAYLSDSSPSKYQSEFAKFLQGSNRNLHKTNENRGLDDRPVSCNPSANIFDSFSSSSSVTQSPTKHVNIKVENWDDVSNSVSKIKSTSPSQIALDHPRSDEVQEQSPRETTYKGPLQTRRSITLYRNGLKKVKELRQQVMCLVQLLFPRLEYPSYFRSGSICVEVLLDQIIAVLKTDSSNKPINCVQSIPLENVCCDVRVLICSRTGPKTCLNNLRRKICKFLQHVLPNLTLGPSFQRTGENVDELLYQVIECNSEPR